MKKLFLIGCMLFMSSMSFGKIYVLDQNEDLKTTFSGVDFKVFGK